MLNCPSDSSSSRFRIGPEVGVYLPTDGTVRDRFGKSWLSLGLGFGSFANVTDKGGLGFDLSLQYQKHGDNRVFLLPAGLGYRVALSQTDGSKGFVPYAGITGDVYFADIRAVQDNVHSGFHESGGGSLLLGANLGTSANVEARYQFVGRIKGYDFSGLSLTAGYRF